MSENNNPNPGGNDGQQPDGQDPAATITDAPPSGSAPADQPPGSNAPEGDPAKANPDITTNPDGKATRPDWLKEDKFWDAEKGEVRSQDLLKSYQELEKKFRAGDHKAPEAPDAYKVNVNDDQRKLLFGEGATEDQIKGDPVLKAANAWAHKWGLPQAGYDEFLDLYAGVVGPEAEKLDASKAALQIDVGAEKAKLGKNADAIIGNQMDFISQLVKTGQISQESAAEAQILFETAAGIKLFQAIRTHYGEQPIPTDIVTQSGLPSREELSKMSADPRYGNDKTYTADVDAKYAQLYGTAPAMSSVRDR